MWVVVCRCAGGGDKVCEWVLVVRLHDTFELGRCEPLCLVPRWGQKLEGKEVRREVGMRVTKKRRAKGRGERSLENGIQES